MTTRTIAPCSKCGSPSTAGLAPQAVLNRLCLACAACDSVTLPPKPELRTAPPETITRSPAWQIAAEQAPDGTLWSHQSMAMQLCAEGQNVAMATATASGKTLPFQFWALHLLTNDPEARTLVFYPTKALANDQRNRWFAAAASLGLPKDTVGQIDGDVAPNRRDQVLQNSRILIMTPDVCHAWLLRRSSSKTVSRFLASMKLIIIDEAHAYESIFGSNAAYLFRRLTAAAIHAGASGPPQYIAATATILEPETHLQKLTGQPFRAISDADSGSPRYQRTIHHIADEQNNFDREHRLAELITAILDTDPAAQLIAFCDSRQAVERIAQITARPDTVLPYRSGYRPDERRDIENRLRNNEIRAVVATSALELGIDMPDINYGLNLNLPPTRKQFHQRLGRVGRTRPATFVALARGDHFTRHGDTLKNYMDHLVEPAHLYLDNEYITYQQATCLREELESRNLPPGTLPDHCNWPGAFRKALSSTLRTPPSHLASLHKQASVRPPHIAFSLRSTGEETVTILDHDGSPSAQERPPLGTINLKTALREAYPGAIYRHQGQSYRAEQWARRSDTFEPFIRTTPVPDPHLRTEPISRTVVTIYPDDDHIIDDKWKDGAHGCISHIHIQVSDSVEGISGHTNSTRNQTQLYRDLAKTDPRKNRVQHTMPTTALLLEINQPWFNGPQQAQSLARQEVAQALQSHLAYTRSIAPADIAVATENICMATGKGLNLLTDAIVIYDNVHGGLGLVQHLHDNLQDYATQLTQITPSLDNEGESLALHRARSLISALAAIMDPDQDPPAMPGPANWWMVLPNGTKVTASDDSQNIYLEGTVAGHSWNPGSTDPENPHPDAGGVHYEVTTDLGPRTFHQWQLTPATTSPDWKLWQPSTGQFRDFDNV